MAKEEITPSEPVDPNRISIRELNQTTWIKKSNSVSSGANLNLQQIHDSFVVWGLTTNQPLYAAHVNQIKNSILIVACPIEGSILIESIENSVILVMACHQIRIHEALKTLIISYTRAGPIIEDSTQITVAPFLWTEPIRLSFSGLQVEIFSLLLLV